MTLKRAIATAAAVTTILGASTALAGQSSPGDDDNDYEGRVEKSDQTYFGFDTNGKETKVTDVAAYLSYKCNNYPNGSGLFEVKGDAPIDNDKFSGVFEGKFKPTQMRSGPTPTPIVKSATTTYDVSGKLGKGGDADGKIEATVEFKLEGGGKGSCKAKNDGKWQAKRGKDIDAPLTPAP